MEPSALKTGFHIQTESYQGPFELALELIEARKLLVNELALAQITDDFIAHVRMQESFPVEETANFIQIAATILLIKSKSLIPDLPLTEEEKEDVDDLTRRLAAYGKVRDAARELGRIFGLTPLLPAGERVPDAFFAPSRDLSAAGLEEALERMLAARAEAEELPEARVRSTISIEEMMDRLAHRVQRALTLSFREFTGSTSQKPDVIVSFLALLELVKQGAVAAEQGEAHGDIKISHAAPQTLTPRYE